MKYNIKIVTIGLLIIFASLGLGRFSFGMILPIIQEDLNINTTQIGFVSTVNFIGYFIGVIVSNNLYSRFTISKLLFSVLSLQALFMYLMTFFDNYLIVSLLYGFTGFFIAISNISIIAFISNVVSENIKGKVLGIVVSGNGIAIILSGFLVPYSNLNSWQYIWTILSLLVLLIAVISLKSLKNGRFNLSKPKTIRKKLFLKNKTFLELSSLYVIFGITYIIYLTYFVSTTIEKWQLTDFISGQFWAILGFSSLFSGLIFGHIADKIGPYRTLTFIFPIQMISHLILVLSVPYYFILLSAISFGVTVWAVPAIIALLCNQNFGNKKTAQAYALITVIFSAAQGIAPVLGGFIFDRTDDFSYVFMFSCFILIIGSFLSLIYTEKKLFEIKNEDVKMHTWKEYIKN